jgi:hypothetical protein
LSALWTGDKINFVNYQVMPEAEVLSQKKVAGILE